MFDWPLQNPSPWRLRPLKDLTTRIGSGATPRGGKEVYVTSGVSLIRSQNVLDNRMQIDAIARIDDAAATALRSVEVHENDVLLNITGDSIARCSLVDSQALPARVNQHVAIIRPTDEVNPIFLQKFLVHPEFKAFMLSISSGGTRNALTKAQLEQFPIPVPPRRTQDSIAEVLVTLDNKIAVNDGIVKTIDDLGNALFIDCFWEALDSLASGTELPDGWKHMRLEEGIFSLETGMRPRGGVGQYTTGVPSIGAESIVKLATFDYSKLKYVPNDFYSAMNRGKLKSHDILLYKDGGRPGSFEPHVSLFGNDFPFSEMCINEHVYRIRLTSPFTQTFGYFWLCSRPLLEEMRSRGTGVAIPGLNSSAVKELPLIQPPGDRLQKFDRTVSPMVERALCAAKESHTLTKLRDTLLPKLMSGEIRVRAAKKLVEDAA